jgi:hypothetical protein
MSGKVEARMAKSMGRGTLAAPVGGVVAHATLERKGREGCRGSVSFASLLLVAAESALKADHGSK